MIYEPCAAPGTSDSGVTKSNSFSRDRPKIVTVSAASEQPQLPSPYHMPCVPTLVNMTQPPPGNFFEIFPYPSTYFKIRQSIYVE